MSVSTTSQTHARPQMMGIVNTTPDSFSDGGLYAQLHTALEHAIDLLRQGADIIDIGGESTQPRAQRVDADEQIRRVQPVIRQLRQTMDREQSPARISIDTTLSAVAQAALDAGADIINDISAGRDDAQMFPLAAQRQVSIVLMHMQGSPATMQNNPTYHNVVAEVRDFLLHRAELAKNAGIPHDRIILDPGIGFGKTMEHNLQLLAHLHELVATGYDILLGTSRKRFIRTICKNDNAHDVVGGTCATTALGVAAGVKYFRVHEVRENRHAADVAWHIQQHTKP